MDNPNAEFTIPRATRAPIETPAVSVVETDPGLQAVEIAEMDPGLIAEIEEAIGYGNAIFAARERSLDASEATGRRDVFARLLEIMGLKR